jgi:hypothetical protein
MAAPNSKPEATRDRTGIARGALADRREIPTTLPETVVDGTSRYR